MSVVKAMQPQLALAKLRELLVEGARFSDDLEVISSYLEEGADAAAVLAVSMPHNAEEVEAVMEIARHHRLSVYTPQPWGLAPGRTGIIMDMREMNKVSLVDTRALIAVVEPGVTWEQLLPEVREAGLSIALPACARSPYVLENAMQRGIVTSACRFGNKQLSNFHAVLADGRNYRSGSHALPTATVNWREDGGPNLSRVFLGSHNSMGLPVRGYIYLFPPTEARKVTVKSFPKREGALEYVRLVARQEVGTEVVVLDEARLERLAGASSGGAWTAVITLDGPAELVEHWAKRLDRMAREQGGKAAPAKAAQALEEALENPWYATPQSFSFYTTLDRVGEFDALVAKALGKKGELARTIIPVKHGASAYLQFDLEPEAAAGRKAILDLLPKLADKGAFFDNPTGSLAAHIFSKQPAYFDLLKLAKGIMDPEGMLNPGVLGEVA